MQQSVNSASVIPIKKRRYPLFESPSPPPKENPSTSEDNKQELRTTAATDVSGASKSSGVIVTNTRVENSESKPEPEPAISSEPIDDLRNKADLCSAKESANQEVLASSVGMIVKQEIGSVQTEGTSELELSTSTQNVELPLESKEPLLNASKLENSESNCGKSDMSDSVSLSLILSKEKLDMCDKNDMDTKNVGSDRSNWDLNTSMDEWEGSTNTVSFSDVCEFSKIRNSDKVNFSLSNLDVKTTAAIMGLSLDSGEHPLREHSSNSCISSLLSGQQSEPDDSLGLSLAVPFRDSDGSGKHSFLARKPDSTDVGPSLNMHSTVVNFAEFRSVKLEPAAEASKREYSVKSRGSDLGLSKSNSVKRELVEKHNFKVAFPSSFSSQNIVEHRSIKSELIHERNNEVFKFQDSVRPQYVGRVMQHQESTASSSAMTVPSMPQNPCPSKSSTFTEFNIGGYNHQFSFHSEEAIDHMNKLNEQITDSVCKTLSQDGLCNSGNLTVEDSGKLNATQIVGRPSELCGKIEIANDEEKINLSTEMLEEDTLGSDSESYENQCVSTPLDERQKLCNKEDGEYEEGEVRTPLQHSAREDPIVDTQKTGNVAVVECGLRNMQTFILAGDQSTNTSDYDGKSAISENNDETHSDHIKECVISGHEPKTENIYSRKLSDNVPEIRVDEKRSMSVTIEKRVDLSRQHDVENANGEEVTRDGPTDGRRGTGTRLVNRATDTVNKQIFSAKLDSTSSMVEAPNDNDATKDSNNVGNKSRIINLPRVSAETSYRTKFIPNRLLASGSGKERYADFDGDVHPRGNRNEFYTDKFAKDKPPLRNSKLSFMHRRGRGSGRLVPMHNDWNSDSDFASDNYNGPSGYRGGRHKHTSSIADADLEYSRYRRTVMNDNEFMRHLPAKTIDPTYNHSQSMYDEFDGQLVREKRNLPATHRKGYPRAQSKSPIRSRTRSPGPWSSRRRRSPDGVPEINQHRSPPVYRMRRVMSPDRASYREEMVSRRRGTPSFITRHCDDLRDVDSVPEHVHTRSFNNSNRRSPPPRSFPRTARRDVLDSQEMGDVSVEERRKFIERRAPPNSFRPNYSVDGGSFHFHPNDSPKPYRFCPDGDPEFSERSNVRERDFDERSNTREREFDERSNMREREFDGRMKHQPLVASRRIRDVEEQHDGTYRPGGRVWHDEGFNDACGPKRRRF